MEKKTETSRNKAGTVIPDIDLITSEFDRRYRFKKRINGLFNLIIFILTQARRPVTSVMSS